MSDEQLLRAIETLLLEEHTLAEPAGAASTAALLQGASCGDHVALVVSGANISREVLKRAIGHAWRTKSDMPCGQGLRVDL